MNSGYSPNPRRGSVFLGLAATMLLASGGLLVGYTMVGADSGADSETPARETRSAEPAALESALTEHLGQAVAVQIGESQVALPWQDLGVTVDRDELDRAASLADPDAMIESLQTAGALPLTLDRDAASERLRALKAEHDVVPHDARMDLENRTIHRSKPGSSIDLFASLAALEVAARTGADELALRTIPVAPAVTVKELGIEDISHVLARFETKFSTADFSRNYNLKLAASKLNGHVLQPGVEFSFNEVVGARTEKEGYKIAGVITAGEMVDGLAGGTCQISTTLHGAAFFAGVGVVNATPHSRPSTYVTMGLDATVVYPHVDLKLQNEYDFPVVIHFKVTRGRSIVEILGSERPFDKVVYEREMVEQLEFDTVTREDEAMPVGSMKVDQYGFHGYKVHRIRKFFKDGKMIKRDRWKIRYAPVTEYARLGINPDPNLMAPELTKADKKKKKKRLKEPKMKTFRMEQ